MDTLKAEHSEIPIASLVMLPFLVRSEEIIRYNRRAMLIVTATRRTTSIMPKSLSVSFEGNLVRTVYEETLRMVLHLHYFKTNCSETERDDLQRKQYVSIVL
jgi:hypothetical protein